MDELNKKEIHRLVLKKDDILVVRVPMALYSRNVSKHMYEKLRKKLPLKNQVLILPNDFELSVIGKDEVKEYVKDTDLWQLFEDENG